MIHQSIDITPRKLNTILPFPGTADALVKDVGGKGMSLIQLAAAGFNVPPGIVLTCIFFDPWIKAIQATNYWQEIIYAQKSKWPELCESLKSQAMRLPLTEVQSVSIEEMKGQLAALTSSSLFAVRSSSPQEDLLGASFAGGYETHLGVNLDHLEVAIRRCFASMFDERVFAYKTLRGFDISLCSIAVVVQAQINSTIAGVAFSLNPLNNDYDQIVIDANWGQGETVVGGLVTPDHWVIDKISGDVIEHSIHDKKISRWLRADGSLIDLDDFRRNEGCLHEKQLRKLTALIKQIEFRSGHPVDIEWAITDEGIFILQSRPVTAFVPLPHKLTTAPGQRRRIYMDIALSSGFTINSPISFLGLDVFRYVFGEFTELVLGQANAELNSEDALFIFDGGRMYLDFSNALWLSNPKIMAKKMEMADAMIARTIEGIDQQSYKSVKRPDWVRLSTLFKIPKIIWRIRKLLSSCFLPFITPKRTHRRISEELAAYELALQKSVNNELTLKEFIETEIKGLLNTLFNVSLPSVGPGVIAVKAFVHLAKPIVTKNKDLGNKIDRGFEGNVVVEMSLEMHQLAKQLTAIEREDAKNLEAQLNTGELSPSFTIALTNFMHRFGCRGPMEMDIAHPRYADSPLIALNQIVAMSVDSADYDPAASSARQVENRREAVAQVMEQAGPIRRQILKQLNLIIELFAGLRDTPKHHLLMVLHKLRQRIVIEGKYLHQKGLIDDPNDVFDFSIEELITAESSRHSDLRKIRLERQKYYDQLKKQVINFPPMIDSRGKIHRPIRVKSQQGALNGIGLSPGVVRGQARIMRSPHENPLLKGEVLIAYTTDPGWTPIFANASAIVLEIGGALQHGAVVARELGLPCVAGIEGVTTTIKNGQHIEVDGNSGTIRILQSAAN